MKNLGFTLIELMIILCILGILSAIALHSFTGPSNGTNAGPSVSMDNGPSIQASNNCLHGYAVITDRRGNTTQMLDSNGNGIPCN